jgi:hypothetical protein
MLFFRKRPNPKQQLEHTLQTKRALRQDLARRLNTAEMFVADRREMGERLALDGASDAVLGRAEAATRVAEDRARTLRAALAQLDAQIADIERELGVVVERRYRDTVADALEAMVTAIGEAAPQYDAVATRLIDAVKKSAEVLPEAASFAADLDAVRREVDAASALICKELRAAAMRTRSGEAKIALRAPFELEVPGLLQADREEALPSSIDAGLANQAADAGSAPEERPIAAHAPEIAIGSLFAKEPGQPPRELHAEVQSFPASTIEPDAAKAA